MSDSFERALGIEPVKTDEPVAPDPVVTEPVIDQPGVEIIVPEPPPSEPPLPPGTPLGPDAKADYEYSRKTFRSLIQTGNEAIEGIGELAKMSENPRAYEVLATLLKTVSETTRDLYDLQKKTKDLQQLDAPGRKVLDNGNVNIDKAVFVGTTTDLLKSLKDQENNG